MKDIALMAIVCTCVAFCVGSCGYMSVEGSRLAYETKTACFTAGGDWDVWAQACRRSAP